MRNNIGYPNKNEYITGYGVDTAFNTWDSEYHASSQGFPQHHGCDRVGYGSDRRDNVTRAGARARLTAAYPMLTF